MADSVRDQRETTLDYNVLHQVQEYQIPRVPLPPQT